ncbi:NAD(P)H-dependent oxidoreductase [Lentibacillus cibarius]|uniref:NAD(P)H-dependent oxidoreductase n=1 Tax=Lentibacillus cibarius TaxID=2583219 RepID=A0A549YFG9_9BACI|nr:NAD(P)H-dependent oxidoreductase [Lentibacillus cibarius]TRM10598.1 NAD(P)H-dependent oxidoreductase [Lentibacillus cibarius]
MRTLLIVSHPDILESRSQQYFLTSIQDSEAVTIHHLEGQYPDGKIDVEKEQALLWQHDRVIFQFPLYWYSSPPLLKYWQDMVLEDGFAYGNKHVLAGKEFGLVIMIGVPRKEYQAGGNELFSISELTKPYQAMANKVGMTYMKPLPIFQFAYMDDDQKMDILTEYWQKLTMANDDSLQARETWMIEQLRNAFLTNENAAATDTIGFAIDHMQEQRENMDQLKMVLDDMN